MPWAQTGQADMPGGSTVRADVNITHPLLTEQALPGLPTSSGSETALGHSRETGWTGVRTRDQSPPLKHS